MNKHRAQQNLNLPLTYLYRALTHLCLCLPPSLPPALHPSFPPSRSVFQEHPPLGQRHLDEADIRDPQGQTEGHPTFIPGQSGKLVLEEWKNWPGWRVMGWAWWTALWARMRCCVYLGVMRWVVACGCGVCIPPCVQLRDTPSACALFVAGLPGPQVTETRQLWAEMPWLWSEFPQGQSSLAEQTAARSPEMGAMISSHPGRPNIPAGLDRPCQPVSLRLRPEALQMCHLVSSWTSSLIWGIVWMVGRGGRAEFQVSMVTGPVSALGQQYWGQGRFSSLTHSCYRVGSERSAENSKVT